MGFWKKLYNFIFCVDEPFKDKEARYIDDSIDMTASKFIKLDNGFLTAAEVYKLEPKEVINYLKENENLLFNIVLPMYKFAIDNRYLTTYEFMVLLKEAFVLDNKADTILGKINNINFYNQKYYNKLERKIYKGVQPSLRQISKHGTPSYIVRSDAISSLKNLYIARIYFLMDSNENWASEGLKNIKYYFNFPESKKIVTKFIKNSYMFTFAKMFAFKKLVDDINCNKKSEIYKIINNAINKFGNHDQIAEKTYQIFLDNSHFLENEFTQTNYKEFISFMVDAVKSKTNLYDETIIKKLNLADLSKSRLMQYNASQLAKSIIYYKMFKCDNLISYFKEWQALEDLKHQITAQHNKEDLLYNDYTSENQVTIDDIDLMSGTEFEKYIKQLLESMGYKCQLTKTTGDQGIDIIAEKDKTKIAIQTKCYSAKVGNHAIMEAVAGMKHYTATKCMVITNNYFTKSAIELAKSNNVVLWNRDTLVEKIYNGEN